MFEDHPPETPAETPQIPLKNEWPIRAEIALPVLNNLSPDGGNLPEYQRRFARLMYEKGARLKCLFGKAVHAIHPKMGTIDVVGSPETVDAILKASRGEILALHHHWSEDAIRKAQTSGVTLSHPELATPQN